ncbi:hypothetical protein ACI2OX_15400 [Bacillus sp. N9]
MLDEEFEAGNDRLAKERGYQLLVKKGLLTRRIAVHLPLESFYFSRLID